MTIVDELEKFISQTKNAQECKRALCVKMWLLHVPSNEIQEHLGVSSSFISKWKNQAIFHGIETLKVQYKGSTGRLTVEQKVEVIQWIEQQKYLRLGDLKRHLLEQYNVLYSSDQSYYSLLHSANFSWKKTQKQNPAKDEELVAQKKRHHSKSCGVAGRHGGWKACSIYD